MTEPRDICKTIGTNILDLLRDRNISRLAFARKTGIAYSTLSRIRDGTHNPTILMLLRILWEINTIAYEDDEEIVPIEALFEGIRPYGQPQ